MSDLVEQARKFHNSEVLTYTTEKLIHALADKIEELEAQRQNKEDLINELFEHLYGEQDTEHLTFDEFKHNWLNNCWEQIDRIEKLEKRNKFLEENNDKVRELDVKKYEEKCSSIARYLQEGKYTGVEAVMKTILLWTISQR